MKIKEKSYKLVSALEEALPIKYWESVYQEAKRSNLYGFKTGAIIFHNKSGEIKSKGCSHTHILKNHESIHAEEAALNNLGLKTENLSIVIMSIGRAGNPAYSSKPCFRCLTTLVKYNISNIFWAERDNAGNWEVVCKHPKTLMTIAKNNGVRVKDFARFMRT